MDVTLANADIKEYRNEIIRIQNLVREDARLKAMDLVEQMKTIPNVIDAEWTGYAMRIMTVYIDNMTLFYSDCGDNDWYYLIGTRAETVHLSPNEDAPLRYRKDYKPRKTKAKVYKQMYIDAHTMIGHDLFHSLYSIESIVMKTWRNGYDKDIDMDDSTFVDTPTSEGEWGFEPVAFLGTVNSV